MKIDSQSPYGNAFSIMADVSQLLKDSGREKEIPAVMKRMRSGNYDNLCAVAKEVTFGSIEVINRVNQPSGDGG